MNHYTYRITNIKLNKHYYGTRTTKLKPTDDLGIKYFSSSTDKTFIKDQKQNPSDYKYKIIRIFNRRKKAIKLEIKLHNKFDVHLNESFYNKAKQTSTGFDTTGKTGTKSSRFNIKHTEESKKKIGLVSKNTITVKDKNGKYYRVNRDDSRWLSGELVGVNKETKASKSTKLKMSKVRKGKTVSLLTKEKMKIAQIGHTRVQGHKHPNAKRINIYNNENELMFECHGNFKQVCKDNGLPSNLTTSKKDYTHNTGGCLKKAKLNGNIKFQGWYIKFIY